MYSVTGRHTDSGDRRQRGLQLDAWLDSEPSLKQHVTKVANLCFCQLNRLGLIRRHFGHDATKDLEMVISRLNYCNSRSAIRLIPSCALDMLQRVQNASALLIYTNQLQAASLSRRICRTYTSCQYVTACCYILCMLMLHTFHKCPQ